MNIEYIICNNELVSTLKEETIANTRNIHTDVFYKYSIMKEAELKEYEKNKKIGWRFLEDISGNNEVNKRVICESLGCMLAPIKPFNKLFIWYGKNYDILIKVIQTIMGESLTNGDIFNINKRFALSSIYKGLANITDTIDYSKMKDSRLIKQIINGRNIEIEMKFTDSINWTANTQLIICCDNLSNISNISNDILNQAVFVPIFSNKEADIDLIYKLLGTSIKLDNSEKNNDALRYIMTKAIIAYREAYRSGHLTETAEHKKLLEIFKEENEGDIKSFYNALLKQEGGIEGLEAWIDNRPLQEIFDEYAIFLGYNSSEEITHITQRAFLVNFNKLLPPSITRKNVTVCGHTIKKYVVTK